MRTPRLLAAALAVSFVSVLVLAPSASARYRRPELEKVPVERLVANLSKQVEESPKDAALRMNLARVHAMAYAVRASDIEALKGGSTAWLGYAPRHVPFNVQPTDDREKLAAAKEQLAKAIVRFEE